MHTFRRQADPHLQPERLGKFRAPILAQCPPMGDAPQRFIHEKAERARMVAVPFAQRPRRRGSGQRGGHGLVIHHRRGRGEGREAGLMREQLRDGHAFLARLREFRPHLCHRRRQLDFVLLAGVQQARRRESLRGRPEKHHRLLAPGVLVLPVLEAARQRNNLRPSRHTLTDAPNSP